MPLRSSHPLRTKQVYTDIKMRCRARVTSHLTSNPGFCSVSGLFAAYINNLLFFRRLHIGAGRLCRATLGSLLMSKVEDGIPGFDVLGAFGLYRSAHGNAFASGSTILAKKWPG